MNERVADPLALAAPPRGGPTVWLVALRAIVVREGLRFVQQRGRLVSALVRPLVWLFVFAAGFRAALGLSITPPYQTYITYDTYIIPGLAGMILLFNGMQSSLSLVYDREMGSMRLLLTAPLPRWWLLFAKLLAGTAIGVVQVYAFLAIAALYGIRMPWQGYLLVLPALVVAGLMLGALGLALSSFISQLENFAGVMNFVIFPMFFLSSALYPLWKMAESSPLLRDICALNPFTDAVELIRFALYAKLEPVALGWTLLATVVFLALALWGYDPKRGVMTRKG
jgi:ABC-2 type transport system permease protein